MNEAGTKNLGYEVTPCETPMDFEDKTRYKKIDDSDSGMAAFIHFLPSMMMSETLAEAYLVKFPEGLPHTLLKLKNGGYATTIVDANNQFLDTAAMFKMTAQAQCLAAFSVLSAVTCQYFLTEIFDALAIIKNSVDDVLEFLYGDKRAELIAELNFINYASSVYSSIMASEPQRIATITSIQQAKQIAIKDIEFYINDLDGKAKGSIKDYATFSKIAKKAIDIKKCLEAAMQLYISCSILETYYSDNWESSYIAYVENDISFFLSKCDKRMLLYFTTLEQRCRSLKSPLIGKEVKNTLEEELNKIVSALTDPQKSELLQTAYKALELPQKKSEFYITKNGDVYQTA